MFRTQLSALDNSATVDLPIAPESIDWVISASRSKLGVLGTAQPLTSYQQSETTLKLPGLKLWSDGNDVDLTPILTQLKRWTEPEADTLEPKVLKLTVASRVILDRVQIASLSYQETMWDREARPTKALLDLDLVLAPLPPAPVTPPTTTTLSERERQQYERLISDRYSSNPTTRERYGLRNGETLEVDSNGVAFGVKGNDRRRLGTLVDILGTDGVRPGHRQLFNRTNDRRQNQPTRS